MNILETINNDPFLTEMYKIEYYSFLCDTLTPEQLYFLLTHPDYMEEWAHKVSEKITEAVSKEIANHIYSLETWGKVLTREVKTLPEPVTPDYNISVPYKVKGVKICGLQ